MATSEQAIRVSAKGEFAPLQRSLKELQGDLKGVMGEIDKGARKGGIFDDSSFRALDTYKRRFNDTMNDVNSQFARQNNLIEDLTEKMKSANVVDKIGISETIKAREKELDVIRRQLVAVEKMYDKRNKEASSFDIKVPGSNAGNSGGSSSGGTSNSSSSGSNIGATLLGTLTGAVGKLTSVIGTVGKFALGLAGVGSLMSMAQEAYQIAYQREVGSLDLAQRIRGYGFSGSASSIYNQVANTGRMDRMGYTEAESWALQDAYSSRGGALPASSQFALQKFARGYGLDATQVGSTFGTVKQLGGTVQPKDFANMIAGSVSQSGMLPRIYEVMQAHTMLLSNINTTFKDGSSSQILAYQTTLDRLGNENGMTKLTGQQGANVISGLNGIFQPGNDKWQWVGMQALQSYNPSKYGNMGLYGLQENFEDGLQNADNLPAMASYLKTQAGGNNDLFKRLMQAWLQDGGYNATKRQVDELDQVTNGFTAFDKSKIDQVVGTIDKTDSGSKYDSERLGEYGQQILNTNANIEKALGDIGQQYLLPLVEHIKEGFSNLLRDVDSKNPNDMIKDIEIGVAAIAAIMALNGGAKLVGSLRDFFKGGKGGSAGKAVEEAIGKKGVDGAENAKSTESTAGDAGSNAGGAAGGAGKEIGENQFGKNAISRDLTNSELLQIQEISKDSALSKSQLQQIYKASGDMDTVKAAASGKMDAADIIDTLSNGDSKVQQELSDYYEANNQDIKATMQKAKELEETANKASTEIASNTGGNWLTKLFKGGESGEGGLLSKFASGAGGATKGFLKNVLGKGNILGGLVDLGFNLYDGNNVGRSLSSAGGSMIGMAGGGAIGESLGSWAGGLLGSLLGPEGTVAGAAAGGSIGGFIGSVGGGMFGDWAGGKTYDFFTGNKAGGQTDEAANNLIQFAQNGELNIDGLSTQGLQKLEELKQQGLISYTDMQTSTTANVSSMSEEGKQDLLKLQQEGLIAIGGLQENGSVKITALSDEGTAALKTLNSSGVIAITDFQKTGKLQITSLSQEGAKSLLNLQKDGSASLTSMDSTTLSKLTQIRKDTGDTMDNILKEHKGIAKTVSDWLASFWNNIKGFFHIGGSSSSSSSGGGGTTNIQDRTGSQSVDKNTDVRGNTDSTSADVLNSKLGGKLSGHGQDFIDAGKKYNIDPTFLAAVSMFETGNGSVLNYNNPAGMMDNGGHGFKNFDSLSDGIMAEAELLASNTYIGSGHVSPADIQPIYCPVGADNDPNNTNGYWLDGVTNQWQQLVDASNAARSSSSSSTGSSVGGSTGSGTAGGAALAGWQSRITSGFGEDRGSHNHGGIDISNPQGTEVDALAGGKIAFLDMDDGGQYDTDGAANSQAGGTDLGVTMSDGKTYLFYHLSEINPDILSQWESGNHDISVEQGQWLANSGGTPGIAGSGYSTTGAHLHVGLEDSSGSLIDPTDFLNSVAGGTGDGDAHGVWDATSAASLAASQASQGTKDVHVTVDVNLQGPGAAQLNSSTMSQLQGLIQQAIQAYEAQKLAMNPTVRGY